MGREHNINVAECYLPLWQSDKKTIVMKSGRASGKSKAIGQLVVNDGYINGYHHCVTCLDTDEAIKRTVRAEQLAAISEAGYVPLSNIPKQINTITNMLNGNELRFIGIGHSTESTKGYKTERPIKYVIIEEAQKLQSYDHLNQALISLRRNMEPDGKIIIAYNPPPNPGHWINEWFETKVRVDSDILVIESSYKDIVPYLNREELKEILKVKRLDFGYYEWCYEGKVNGLGDKLAIPTFKEDRHVLSSSILPDLWKEQPIALVIGGDNSIIHDKTGLVPMMLFPNGKAYILEPFYYDPMVYAPLEMSTMAKYILNYLEYLFKRYSLWRFYSKPNDYQRRALPIVFTIDCAAIGQSLSLQLGSIIRTSRFAKAVNIEAFTDKHIQANNAVVRTLFAQDKLFIVDSGGYYDPITDGFKASDTNIIVKQLKTVIWDEKMKGYVKSIENDILDALIYGANKTFATVTSVIPDEYRINNSVALRPYRLELKTERTPHPTDYIGIQN